MKVQNPAEGIMLTHEWGQSKMYKISCGCGQPYHDHDVEVEADDTGVNVNIYISVKTDYWTETFKPNYGLEPEWAEEFDSAWKSIINSLIRKVKLTWELWTTGAVTSQTTITMSEQQALNYAEALKLATKDVKEFRDKRING